MAATHAERASLVVLTIDHAATTLRAVTLLLDTYPGIPIVARARDLEASTRLQEAGATQAYPVAIEACLRLGATAPQMVGAPADNVDLLLQGVRQSTVMNAGRTDSEYWVRDSYFQPPYSGENWKSACRQSEFSLPLPSLI